MIRILRQTVAVIVALSLLPAWPVVAADASANSSTDRSRAEKASLDNIVVGSDQIQIQMSRPAKYNTFTTANPPRIVVEILGASVNMSSRVLAGSGANLKRIRAGQFQGEPDWI